MKASKRTGQPLGARVTNLESRESWWRRQRDDLSRDLLVAIVVGILVLVAGFVWDERLAERDERNAETLALNAEMLENTRYVRSLAGKRDQARAFGGMYLRDATLAGLDLSCRPKPSTQVATCAVFDDADMRDADLLMSSLQGASMSGTDLRGAVLAGTTLVRTTLWGADLEGATFEGAEMWDMDLRHTDLSEADLESVDLRRPCHDETTIWPPAWEPPASVDASCVAVVDSGIDLDD